MRCAVFVEGPSDVAVLQELFSSWRELMRQKNGGISVVDLKCKSEYLRKIGPRAARRLVDGECVVGLVDLYPLVGDQASPYHHKTYEELRTLQQNLVSKALKDTFNVADANIHQYLSRFFGAAFQHDMEVLLLTAEAKLKSRLGTADNLSGAWRRPPETQNHNKPPKYVVEELFKKYKDRKYRDIEDGVAIVKGVQLHELYYTKVNGAEPCPRFRSVLDWVAQKVGIDKELEKKRQAANA